MWFIYLKIAVSLVLRAKCLLNLYKLNTTSELILRKHLSRFHTLYELLSQESQLRKFTDYNRKENTKINMILLI